ncbi:hypothetical protein SS1G_09363 [Sclerotinia sclerotiorum 1980 UF-70]|uniref:feruloyl esterase n=2 Tax=Sclerotinia sclerotiorum (strain ATCC 18683 / 1980 / Ss-1) TaxID=665079 RepID=A7EVK4_SCLS1|nr:hypothetical protein SS1G_09363 [Sclerotinia sclerotiorum 1980 UF-70]APA15788.1 hypothetical protein sscle_15g105580 [Sclerotinia sclerotiorum 1980 UF-70]EDN93496.1 hypothetical protein SS1G_09363 [Sclerotinia sclerotiorum 1980 UF-70]
MVHLKNAIFAFAAHISLGSLKNPLGAGVAASCACTKTIRPDITIGQPKNISIISSNVTRSYLIVVPPLYTNQNLTPVIFSFHGGNRNASEQLTLDQISYPEFNNFSITIYPQGVKGKWEGDPGNTANDTQLVSDIIDSLSTTYCIDSKRIWATGKSDGGGFCNTLACHPILSTKIAAFAPVSGAFYIDTQPCHPHNVTIPCSQGRPKIPMLEFHGGNDSTIHYEGQANRSGECIPSIPHWVREWALRDELGLENVTTVLTNDTVIYNYGKGDDEGLVKHVFDKNLGHDWPSTVLNDDLIGHGEGPASFNATPIILDWFQKHVLP